MVSKGKIEVKIARPPGTDMQITPVFAALRNHYRLITLYNHSLGLLEVGPIKICFDPEIGKAPELEKWQWQTLDKALKALVGNISVESSLALSVFHLHHFTRLYRETSGDAQEA